ncbi:hypothetical protein [Clostridium sp.]|uniref:hypothetical protein n=1 Tax=Clostridium sp. TaxID=1506 RepID=UPI00262F8077|nr:hypothetical protein [uncultured Clostridium sp.]
MYDIAIVGSGVSGIFLAYTLLQEESNIKILIIERGRKFIERICPIENGVSAECLHCSICNKTQGFGGMGRSEGKYNYTNDFGGQIGEKIGRKYATYIIESINKGKGRIVVQRYDDLLQGRVTTKHNLDKNTIKPSLQGEVGDCSGTTYSLSQAAVSGVYLGKYLLSIHDKFVRKISLEKINFNLK